MSEPPNWMVSLVYVALAALILSCFAYVVPIVSRRQAQENMTRCLDAGVERTKCKVLFLGAP